MKQPTSLALLLLLVSYPAGRAAAQPPTFEQHVRPILKAHCFECHGDGKKLRGSLDLRLVRLMRDGGDSGAAVVAGKPQDSVLLKRVLSHEMPPGKKKLSPGEIDLIRRWISAGAKTARAEPEKLATGFHISAEDEAFWSFQPVRRPEPPAVKAGPRVRTPIDAFVLAGLEAKGLSLSPDADRPTLIRRAYFDLTGLPPTPAEVDAFVADAAADAWEKVVDRLLASPHYGERWGRHWLDVAGYADSEGFTGEDPLRGSAWRYRDYVIRAFNADMPFDEFLREQIAGDELVRPPYDQLRGRDLDRLIATGFLRMAPDGSASKVVDLPAATNQTVADTIQIVATATLGLTVHCAQCHNHRYDPIAQEDYYRFRAVFEPALDWKNWRKPAAREVLVRDEAELRKAAELEKQALQIDQERVAKEKVHVRAYLDRELAALPAEVRDRVRAASLKPVAQRSQDEKTLLQKYPKISAVTLAAVLRQDRAAAAELAALTARAAEVRAAKPAPLSIRALTEVPGRLPVTYLFDRGEYAAPRHAVKPGTLTVLQKHVPSTIPEADPNLPTSGRRLAFARWLTHAQNPLTARVLVNRVWMHHFGRGLVNTPGDFGALGERPTHPELLDWLASEFTAGGWKLKRLHRLILTSSVYRQASTRTPALQQADPDNKLLGRMSVRRVEAEVLRDAMLAVSGRLNGKAFGPPVPIRTDDAGQVVIGVDTDDTAGRPTGKVVPLNGEEFRRSVYVTVRRSKPLAALEAFDAPMLTPNCECRTPTTVAPQALMLLNSQGVAEEATAFARRLQKEAGSDLTAQVTLGWRYAFAREPAAQDVAGALQFVRAQTAQFGQQKNLPAGVDAPTMALSSYCHALLSSNAFLYVD
jgi:mono/diheme cytochrome c family protein